MTLNKILKEPLNMFKKTPLLLKIVLLLLVIQYFFPMDTVEGYKGKHSHRAYPIKTHEHKVHNGRHKHKFGDKIKGLKGYTLGNSIGDKRKRKGNIFKRIKSVQNEKVSGKVQNKIITAVGRAVDSKQHVGTAVGRAVDSKPIVPLSV